MTSVVGSGASAFFTWFSADAATAVGPLANFTVVLIVQAASSAVSGLPSDHLPPGRTLKVHVLPSGVCDQDSAQSPSNVYFPFSYLYWTSCGKIMMNAL